ncbi:MAG: DMT family transporter [Paracoccaceae bacterium]
MSLGFGISAALAWAVHDLLVRKLTQSAAILPLMLTVLAVGSLALVIPSVLTGGWQTLDWAAIWPALAAGVTYMAGMGGLYQALSRAPVRVVAPVLGAFPMLSLGIAAAQGRAVGLVEWLAVAAIVAGIAWVALSGRGGHGQLRGSLGAALGWAVLGAMGFAATFALGQAAARAGAELPTMAITRVTALAGVLVLSLASRSPLRAAPGMGRALIGMGLLDALALALVTASARLPHPEYAAVAAALFGVLTIVLAWRFLGEKVAAVQWAGIAVVFAGIATLSLQG